MQKLPQSDQNHAHNNKTHVMGRKKRKWTGTGTGTGNSTRSATAAQFGQCESCEAAPDSTQLTREASGQCERAQGCLFSWGRQINLI